MQITVMKKLLRDNFEFRKLYEEHTYMEAKLKRLDGLRHLTPDEAKERKRIQKMKLWGKDRMYELIRKTSQRKINA